MTKTVHVAVGILSDAQGRILITRRPDHVHQGGLWEFPGGKVEPGETLLQALDRELHEELGVRVDQARPLIRIHHAYPDKTVLLDVWRVTRYRGAPRGLEGQPLDWRAPDALSGRAFPAADVPIINALRLPDTCLVTGPPAHRPAAFLRRLQAALERGVRLVQLRAGELPARDLTALYRDARDLCRASGAALLLNGPPELAQVLDADGVHLNSRRLWAVEARPLAQDRWVSAACHDRTELERAQAIGVDFVLVSPVLPTASHPQAVPLGWEGLARLAEAARVPVYALGGMAPEHRDRAWTAGAQGIAAIGSLWPGVS